MCGILSVLPTPDPVANRTLACHGLESGLRSCGIKQISFHDRVTPRGSNNKSVVLLNPVYRFDFERIDLAIG